MKSVLFQLPEVLSLSRFANVKPRKSRAGVLDVLEYIGAELYSFPSRDRSARRT